MIRSICVWIVRFCAGHVTSWAWPALLTGLGCSCLLLNLIVQYYSQLGTSAPVTAATSLMIGLAWAAGWAWTQQPASNQSANRFRQALVLPIVLTLWIVIAPLMWSLHDLLIHPVLLTSSISVFALVCSRAALLLVVPVFCIARLTLHEPGTGGRQQPSAACLLGIALGFGLAPVITFGSLYVTAIIGAVILLLARTWAVSSENLSAASAASDDLIELAPSRFDGAALLTAVACGGLTLCAISVVELLLPATIYTVLSIVAGVFCGISFATRLKLQPSKLIDGRLLGTCLLVVSVLTLTAGFSAVVFRTVTVTGVVSQVWLLQGLRWAFIVCCFAPVGAVWAWSCGRLPGIAMRLAGMSAFSGWGLGVLLVLVGAILTSTLLLPVAGLSVTCYVWLWCIVGVQIFELVQLRAWPHYSLVRVFGCGCLCLTIAGPVVSGGVRPDLAARLLFATSVFQADQARMPRSELPFLDDARLVEQALGTRGFLTAWKSTITRHQIRENGIPRGTLSTDSQVNPQDSSEVILSLLPLTLHDRPSRVALLGIGASVPLQTCLACPIPEVTVVETDPQLVSLLQRISANTEAAATWQDERMKLQIVDPALWIAATQEQFDVLISNPDPSSLVDGAAWQTREFYQRASRRLSADGIFCQRFQYHDYGPAPLQTLAATLRSVFRHVLAVEMGPGEVAWLGTNSEAGFIRSNLVERMQAEHVRNLMASVGWDWSVLLTLAAYDDECLAKVAAPGSTPVNSACNGRLCLRLPNELMRWGPKAVETQKAVTAHASKLLNWVGKAGTDENVLRRLAEVRGQQEVVSNFPDQFWGYRNQVRKHIASRPLSKIEQVKYEDEPRREGAGLHPDDKRRLRYFQQLSKAVHTQQPAEVLKLADYDAPFDPLVSLFMHEELAEIAAHVPGLPPRVELMHRLHKLNYAPSFDPSVRNALSALRLVFDKPECLISQTERWEVINGLLQALQYRWQIRVPAQNQNARLAARDVEENIILAERALQELPALAIHVGYSAEDCKNRERVIQRTLLGPLRDYRELLRPYDARQQQAAGQQQIEGTLPTEEELQFPGSGSEAE